MARSLGKMGVWHLKACTTLLGVSACAKGHRHISASKALEGGLLFRLFKGRSGAVVKRPLQAQ